MLDCPLRYYFGWRWGGGEGTEHVIHIVTAELVTIALASLRLACMRLAIVMRVTSMADSVYALVSGGCGVGNHFILLVAVDLTGQMRTTPRCHLPRKETIVYRPRVNSNGLLV
jgi:hypothetical protein